MIIFSSKEKEKEFRANFDAYVSNLKKLKTMQSDTAVVFSDFVNTTWTGLESWEKKEKKKEVTKFKNTYVEVSGGKEPVEAVKETRYEHLDLSSDKYDYLVSIIQQKMEDDVVADSIKDKNEALIAEMCNCFVESAEVSVAVIKELGAEVLGRFFILDRVSAGVEEGRKILFGTETQE